MSPYTIRCLEHGEFSFPDEYLGLPLNKGGVQEQKGAREIIGRDLFLANCPKCYTTLEATPEARPKGEEKTGNNRR